MLWLSQGPPSLPREGQDEAQGDQNKALSSTSKLTGTLTSSCSSPRRVRHISAGFIPSISSQSPRCPLGTQLFHFNTTSLFAVCLFVFLMGTFALKPLSGTFARRVPAPATTRQQKPLLKVSLGRAPALNTTSSSCHQADWLIACTSPTSPAHEKVWVLISLVFLMNCNPYQLLLFWVRVVLLSSKWKCNCSTSWEDPNRLKQSAPYFTLLRAGEICSRFFLRRVFSCFHVIHLHLHCQLSSCPASGAVSDVGIQEACQYKGDAPLLSQQADWGKKTKTEQKHIYRVCFFYSPFQFWLAIRSQLEKLQPQHKDKGKVCLLMNLWGARWSSHLCNQHRCFSKWCISMLTFRVVPERIDLWYNSNSATASHDVQSMVQPDKQHASVKICSFTLTKHQDLKDIRPDTGHIRCMLIHP